MSDPQPESLRDLAPGYALGALSAEETAAFERALAGDPELQREVAEYREVNALLGESGARVPSPLLKARLRERIRGQDGESRPRRSFAPFATAMALAAMLLLAIGLTLKVRVLSNELQARDSLLRASTAKLAEREATLNAILEPNVQLTTLVSTGAAPVVQIFFDRVKRTLLVHTFQLAPAPGGRVYQLWLMPRRGAPVPSRTFNTEADGHQLVQAIPVPADLQLAGFAVSVEPEGGSPQPTTTPILVGLLSGSR